MDPVAIRESVLKTLEAAAKVGGKSGVRMGHEVPGHNERCSSVNVMLDGEESAFCNKHSGWIVLRSSEPFSRTEREHMKGQASRGHSD